MYINKRVDPVWTVEVIIKIPLFYTNVIHIQTHLCWSKLVKIGIDI